MKLGNIKTNKELEAYIVTKIFGQGGPCVNEEGTCTLRGHTKEDQKCAVGWCIADEFYRPTMEDAVGSRPITVDSDLGIAIVQSLPCFEDRNIDFGMLFRLQQAHDNASTFPESDFNYRFICFTLTL